ncbi:MAG: hypothetical protein NC393_01450 [Clostridium sp.]|nr:hypothetical protein [Clostridium sp.]
MLLGLDGQIPYIYYKLNEGVDACLSFSFLDSHNILVGTSAASLLPKSLLGIMRIRRIDTMKRRMISALLSVVLVIATICVSNLPSAAVEPNAEMTQEEMQHALETSEAATEELTEEVTEPATEEKTKEATEKTTEEITKRDENSILTKEVVTDESVDASDNSKVTNADAVSDNGNSSEKTSTDLSDEKNGQGDENGIAKVDTAKVDADTDIAGELEDGKVSAQKRDEDMVLSDEEAEKVAEDNEADMELFDEDASEEELLVGAEVEKLENVRISSWSHNNSSEGKREYEIVTQVTNNNEFDIYLSCLRGYVTDEKGNEYNVPVSVEVQKKISEGSPAKDYVITNDSKGYWGYSDESVLTDEGVLHSADIETAWYCFNYTVPVELKGNFQAYIYIEFVRLDDTGKIISLCGQSGTYFEYDRVINIENSNYCISESAKVDLGNVDLDVYYDGNYLIAGTERIFYIQISNKNDFDICLKAIRSYWATENYDSEDEAIKDMLIIAPDGRNITNWYDPYGSTGYDAAWDDTEIGGSVIKAGETVTYRVNCRLSSEYSEKDQLIDFRILLGGSAGTSYYYECDFMPLDNAPTVSIDKVDETTPDLKLDDEAYDELINSAFTKEEIKSGKHLKVDLIVAALSEASVGQSDLEAIKTAAKKRKIAVILDMNIVKFIDGIVSGNVNKLDKEITITIDVPKEFQAANRKFSIIRLHDGIAEELPDLDDNPNTVTFTTGKFSFYTLIYEDVEDGTALEPSKNDTPSIVEPSKTNVPDVAVTPVKAADNTKQTASPNTGDAAPIAVMFSLMLVSAFLAVISIQRIKKNK